MSGSYTGVAWAMGRPTDWWVLDLDRDPTPGEPTRVRELAGRLHAFADDVSATLRDVRGLARDSAVLSWAGQSGDAYREQFTDVPGELTKLERSYRMAGDALEKYWPTLQESQRQADRALDQGRTARDGLSRANAKLDGAESWVQQANARAKQYQQTGPGAPPPDPELVRAASRDAQQAAAQLEQTRNAASSAQSQLDAAKRLAAQAASLRDGAANSCVRAIREASDAGIKNKRWWEKAVDWVADHWDEIVTVCKWIVAIAGIIVLIIGGPLAWLVFAAALVVLADAIMKYAQGKVSAWLLLFAVLDCIPGGKGITSVARLAQLWKAGGLRTIGKAAFGAMRGKLGQLASTVRGLGAATKTIWKGLPGALGDPLPSPGLALPGGGSLPGGGPGGFGMLMSEARDAFRAASGGEKGLIGIPDATRLRPSEQATAARLQQLPEFAGRTFSESPHVGAEYVDDLGRSYDALGVPEASRYWNEPQFLDSITSHLNKSNDFTVVDLTDFTQPQIDAVRRYVDNLPEDKKIKIIRIGF